MSDPYLANIIRSELVPVLRELARRMAETNEQIKRLNERLTPEPPAQLLDPIDRSAS